MVTRTRRSILKALAAIPFISAMKPTKAMGGVAVGKITGALAPGRYAVEVEWFEYYVYYSMTCRNGLLTLDDIHARRKP